MSEEDWLREKKGLLTTMMRTRFEDRVYDKLETGDFHSIDELDAWLDEALTSFRSELQAVSDYYDKRISEISS